MPHADFFKRFAGDFHEAGGAVRDVKFFSQHLFHGGKYAFFVRRLHHGEYLTHFKLFARHQRGKRLAEEGDLARKAAVRRQRGLQRAQQR